MDYTPRTIEEIIGLSTAKNVSSPNKNITTDKDSGERNLGRQHK